MQPSKPEWLRIRAQRNETSEEVEALMKKLSLHTVCEEANCPNRGECFSRRTATFMILGSVCTRNCTFCNVEKGCALEPDALEPLHVAEAVKELRLKHVVVTSVTRDDLPDGGAGHFANVIDNIRTLDGNVVIEVLIPDFQGNRESLARVVAATPHIINHNVETISRLYPTVRPMARYRRSLELLQNVKEMDNRILTKSGIMVGLGEEETEVIQVLKDLREVQCDLLTIGQYLAPSRKHHPVVEYIHPDIFEYYKKAGLELGFRHIAAGPFVRSSYLADKALENIPVSRQMVNPVEGGKTRDK